eukprot:TRINITY_DN41688_c0_g1_i1.p1 TRINITY_DN41688_c0_g1~~TRINITY_DN41688_c0_g1_i1.p1  ORF type:complete len:952 (-),score=243.89 TRINITY_DN41688_c0_g1_i1:343-3198(-)
MGDGGDTSLPGLRRKWEQLALRLGAGTGGDDQGLSGGSYVRLGNSRVDVDSLSAVAAWLPLLPDFMQLRAVCQAFRRAVEQGPARGCWEERLGVSEAARADANNESLAMRLGHRRFLLGGSAAKGLKRASSAMPRVESLMTKGRLRGSSEPLLSLPDGSAATILDKARVVAHVPEVVLTVWDIGSLVQIGAIPFAQMQHGQTIQRPLNVVSFCAAPGSGCAPGSRQACLVALERLVAVFSWQLGQADTEADGSGLRLSYPRAEEVRWGSGAGRESLRSASFIGSGPNADVAVLLDGSQARRNSGPLIELYGRTSQSTAHGAVHFALRAVVTPLGQAPDMREGSLAGCLAVWGTIGSTVLNFAPLPPVPKPAVPLGGDAAAPGAAGQDKAASKDRRAGGAAAAFARARQVAKTVKLRVGEGETGAGLDLEMSRWGYLIEEIDPDPGQPELHVGDIIIAVAGQALHGLPDEATMQWRFGRNFKGGADLTILPAKEARHILDLDVEDAVAAEEKEKAEKQKEGGPPPPEQLSTPCTRLDLPDRLDAWCVTNPQSTSPTILAVVGNRLLLIQVPAEKAAPPPKPQTILAGVARDNWKPPIQKMGLVVDGGDLVFAAVSRAVLIWRVPELLDPLKAGPPELITAVPMPPRCTLGHASMGFGVGATADSALGWICAELGGINADCDGGLDIWRFHPGRSPPPLALSASTVSGSALGAGRLESGDTVAMALSSIGGALSSLAQAAAIAGGMPEFKSAADAVAWVEVLPNIATEAIYRACDSAEKTLGIVARELRSWLRQQQQQQAGEEENAATKDGPNEGTVAAARVRRIEDAKAALRCGEDVRRMLVWPLQQAFKAPASDSDSDDGMGGPPGGGGPAPAAPGQQGSGNDLGALRRQRWLQQRQQGGKGGKGGAAATTAPSAPAGDVGGSVVMTVERGEGGPVEDPGGAWSLARGKGR